MNPPQGIYPNVEAMRQTYSKAKLAYFPALHGNARANASEAT